jgi:hypothetical protein
MKFKNALYLFQARKALTHFQERFRARGDCSSRFIRTLDATGGHFALEFAGSF